MKKIFTAALFFLAPLSIHAEHTVDRYGGWYNTVIDTAPYNLHYRFYVDPGKTGVNDFEYRSILQDIFTIYAATPALSECTRQKVIGVLLEERVDIYMTYPPGVQRSSVPFDLNTLNVCEEGRSFYQMPPVEAEAGKLYGDWTVRLSTMASGGKYIQANSTSSYSVFYVSPATGGVFNLWTRTLDISTGSFYVAIDTRAAHEFKITTDKNWNMDPVPVDIRWSNHWLTIWNKDGNLALDKIIITQDKNYIP